MLWFDLETKFGKRVTKQLAEEQVIWLTTVTAQGVPQPSPVWFWWDGETFLIYSQPDKPKVHNIAVHPTVSLHFNSDFDGHEIAIFRGTAVSDPAISPANQHPDYLAKYREGIAGINMTPESFAAAYSLPIRVTPMSLRGY